MDQQQPQQQQADTSLETVDTTSISQAAPGATADASKTPDPGAPKAPKRKLFDRIKAVVGHFNLYLLGFVLLLIVTGIGLYIFTVVRSQKDDTTKDNNTAQTLTDDALNKLKNTDVKVGDPKQVLGIESNTIFSGKVLVRDSLDVAGSLKLGGSLSVPGLTVAGLSTFDQIQTNGISVSGNAAVQGQMTVQRNLNVTGSGSFGGPITAPQITVDTLQLTRDLTITRHIDAGGGTPSKSDGSALGGGGTSSVSGTDTAGTVAINTGGGPPAGCFVTVNFTTRFAGTPHIALTPASSAAGSLDYYVNRSPTGFSVCSSSAPVAGQNYTFDYIVID